MQMFAYPKVCTGSRREWVISQARSPVLIPGLVKRSGLRKCNGNITTNRGCCATGEGWARCVRHVAQSTEGRH